MLDLQGITTQYYEIKLLDGKVLQLKRPTQAMMEYLINIDALMKTNELEGFKAFCKMFSRILNRNTEGLKFNEEDLAEEYDFSIVVYVIKDYFAYWNEDLKDKVVFQ
jgi:hypothetical protein